MTSNTAPQKPTVAPGEVRNFAVSFANVLDSGELLAGTPTVEEETTTDLTIASNVVSTAALTINGSSVAAGAAVQFKASGFVDGTSYRIKITVATDATPAQTLVKWVECVCRGA